jgi:hypothetical protein
MLQTLLNTLGLGNCLLSQTLLQPWYKRNAHGITSGAFLFCYREALCGNSVGTLWELFGGTLRELLSGTLQELFGNKGIYLTLLYCTLYKYGKIYYIVINLYYIVSRIV